MPKRYVQGFPVKIDDFVSVRDWAAKGDNSTDDTAAFQTAIDKLQATGGIIYVPEGLAGADDYNVTGGSLTVGAKAVYWLLNATVNGAWTAAGSGLPGTILNEAAAGSGLDNLVEDTTPQLGGNLDVNGNDFVSTSDGDITLTPDGTGNIVLGNFTINADATVGAGQDNYVLTYDHSAGTWGPEASAGGGGGGLSNVVEDTTPQLGGSLDVNGNSLVSVSDGDITLEPDGTGAVNLNAADVYIEQDLIHTGDANNKFVFGTDTQDFQTGGSSRLDISDSGVRLGGANARVTTVLDEDNMASDSATALATQQSVKAYVDSSVSSPSGGFTYETATSLTSGSTSDYTIPSGVNMIVVSLSVVDISGADDRLIRLGDAGGVEATGYDSNAGEQGGDSQSTSGFILERSTQAKLSGTLTFMRVTGNTWAMSGGTSDGGAWAAVQGVKTLSEELTTIRLATSGSNTFVSGTWNVMYA